MAMKTFSDTEVLLFGWKKAKENVWFFAGILVITLLAAMIPDILTTLTKNRWPFLAFIIGLAFFALQMLIGMGLVKIALKVSVDEKPRFSELFSCYPLFLKYLLGILLYSLMVFAGFILFIVPGIILAVKFQFFPYFIVDKNMTAVEALKKSAAITNGAKWDLLAFNFLASVVNLLGVLCLFVGIFLAFPAVMVGYAFIYRRLLEQADLSQTVKP